MPTLKQHRGHPLSAYEKAAEMARDPLNLGLALDDVDDTDNYGTEDENDITTTEID